MSGLLEQVSTDGVHHTTVLQLHCPPCNTVHALPLADVERIVYALIQMEGDAYGMAMDDPAMAAPMADDPPTCLTTVLMLSHVPDVYGEYVEQGVACRKASVDA